MNTYITQVSRNIVRVSHVPGAAKDEPGFSILVAEDFEPEPGFGVAEGFEPDPGAAERGQGQDCVSARGCGAPSDMCRIEDGRVIFTDGQGDAVLEESQRSLTPKDVYKYVIDGEPVIKTKQTANGEVAYIENCRKVGDGTAFEGKLVFDITEDEAIYGLGQHEDGIYNYNGKKEYLYQTNMKISIPFVISSRNYGILIDTETAMIFEAGGGKMTFTLDTVRGLSYFVITGDGFGDIIKALRKLTGRTPMLPRWAYGYVQSKERYDTSAELIETAARFRQAGIPIDCIVQDWFTWESGLWGDKRADKKRYPDIGALTGGLHGQNVKLMVSIWPNMAVGGSNHEEFREKGLMLPNSTTYDAFREEARALYWKQCEEDWFSGGVDAWWCDSAEPFSDADWNGEAKRPGELRYRLITEDSKKSMDWTRLNTYGLLHSKGIYENWRRSNKEKRVVNLTRSTYISGQRYGAIAWSGDVCAKWAVLRSQIAEGIKYSLCGMPYWTLDIGAFFVVKDKWENRGCGAAGTDNVLWFWDGDYNDGVDDLGYRELYARWLQFGAFLPMFRSHGTDTPREPWNFGEPGEPFYDAILKFMNLRYRLLPYIYSTAAGVSFNDETMVRSLMLDFADDENVRDVSGSYMFGKSLLVSPVTEPMYFDAGSVPVEGRDKVWDVYLPRGCEWFDFWTNEVYGGGQTVRCEAPIDVMPLFVRAGSIIPVSEPLAYADERGGEVSEILVYGGADGEFTLYNDEGDNYSYENGNYCAIKLSYCDKEKALRFGGAQGSFKYQERFAVRLIGGGGSDTGTADVVYGGKELTVAV